MKRRTVTLRINIPTPGEVRGVPTLPTTPTSLPRSIADVMANLREWHEQWQARERAAEMVAGAWPIRINAQLAQDVEDGA